MAGQHNIAPGPLFAGSGVGNDKAVLTVSAKGVANGLSSVLNNNSMYGPDTPGTTTSGIQEAINALTLGTNFSSPSGGGGGKIILGPGIFACTSQITIPNVFPFNLVIEGSGEVITLVKFTLTTDCIVDTRLSTDTSNSSYASLNLVLRDLGLALNDHTQKVYLVRFNWLNQCNCENVLFTTIPQLSLAGFGTNLVYINKAPTTAIGCCGFRMDKQNNNICRLNYCHFYGLAAGAQIAGDHIRIRDCVFAVIGLFGASANTVGTAWTAGGSDNTNYIYNQNLNFLGVALSGQGIYEFVVDSCQWFNCYIGIAGLVNAGGGATPLMHISYPLMETVTNSFISMNDVSGIFTLGDVIQWSIIETFPSAPQASAKLCDFNVPTISASAPANFVWTRQRVAGGGFGGNITAVNPLTGSATPYLVPSTSRVTGIDATTTGQVLVDIPGLSISLEANTTTFFEALLSVATSAVTTGCQYGVQFSAAGASVEAQLSGSLTTSAAQSERVSGLNVASGTYLTTSAQNGQIYIGGVIVTGANAGNLTIRHLKVTSGTSTVRINSILRARRIA